MDYLDYRKKLGIGFNDEEKITYFYTILFNKLDSLNSFEYTIPLSLSEYMNYCNDSGVRGSFSDYYDSYGMRYVIDSLKDASKRSFLTFLVRLVAFMNCTRQSKNACITSDTIKNLIDKCFVKAHIDVEFIKDDDGFFIFPRGAKELDDALVSQQLIWLNDYPKTYKRFSNVLRKYSEKLDSASNIADDFRKVLETFFQEFFNQKKSLENMKSEYGKYMKTNGVPAEISNNMETLLVAYTNYNNSYAKHHDRTEENVLEFLMYQTGIIIRFLITLKKTNTLSGEELGI